ncbi:hypothetical protein JCM21900_004382 [Sporobolomyces salmonicolor]
MAQQSSSIAFHDDFTHSHGGSCFFVAVDPNFASDVTEAATLISRSRPEAERQQYVSQLASAAQAAQPPVPEQPETAGEDEGEKKAVESEDTREAKRKVVAQLLASTRDIRLEATDKEFEGFSNLVLSLVLALFPTEHADFASHVLALADAITFSADRTANPSLSARYASLATLFNSLPSTLHSLRLATFLKLVAYAAQNDDFAVIAPALAKFESWLLDWGFGPGSHGEEEGNAAVSQVAEALISKGKQTEARTLLVSHLSSPSTVKGQASTPSASASKLASTLIALSLAVPDVYDFTALSSSALPAVAHPSVPALAQLLQIFQSGDLAAFSSFDFSTVSQAATGVVLDKEQLEKKLKLVKLAELCSERVGQTVAYGEIAQALGLNASTEDEGEEVETWVIDAIRASLLTGRLSQPTQSLSITRALPRSFTASHWSLVQTRLESWRASLDSILSSTEKGLGVRAERGEGVGASEVIGQQEEQVQA